MRSQKARETAWTGMLFALAIALSYLESLVSPLLGLMPAIKLGLSNIVVMYALLFLRTRTALLLVVLKALFAFLTRGATAGFLSLCGGALSLAVMLVLLQLPVSGYIFCAGSALAHNLGQLAGAAVLLSSAMALGFAVLAQLPYQLAFPANGIAGFVQFNMLFTLLLCFLVLLVQEKIRDRVLRSVCIVLLICASLFCDWALLAPVFTLLFAWAGGNRTRQKAAFGAAALLYGGMAGLGSGQVWEAVGCAVPILVSAFVILYLYNGRRAARGRTFYKWFFYAFYPAHLLVLGLLRLAV